MGHTQNFVSNDNDRILHTLVNTLRCPNTISHTQDTPRRVDAIPPSSERVDKPSTHGVFPFMEVPEIWKDIPNLSPFACSSYGRIKNLQTNNILKPHYKGHYCRITFRKYRKTFLVHRIIAKLFIPNPSGKSDVNHIDSHTDNNNILNLEWCTHAENMQHASKANRWRRSKKHLIDEFISLRISGFTYKNIGIKMGVGTQTARNYIKNIIK